MVVCWNIAEKAEFVGLLRQWRSAAVMAVAAVVTLLFRGLTTVLLLLLDRGLETALSGWRAAFLQALTTGLLAPLGFHVLSRIDARLWRDPRAQGLGYGNPRSLY